MMFSDEVKDIVRTSSQAWLRLIATAIASGLMYASFRFFGYSDDYSLELTIILIILTIAFLALVFRTSRVRPPTASAQFEFAIIAVCLFMQVFLLADIIELLHPASNNIMMLERSDRGTPLGLVAAIILIIFVFRKIRLKTLVFYKKKTTLREHCIEAYGVGVKSEHSIETVVVNVEHICPKCGGVHKLYAKISDSTIDPNLAEQSAMPFPKDNKLTCHCGFVMDLTGIRNPIERNMGKDSS